MLVKANQPELCRALQEWFDHPTRWQHLDCRTASMVSKGHGRLERRTVTVSAACCYLDWPGLQQVIHFETWSVNTKTQAVSHQHCFAITSLSPRQASATQLLALRRQHWAIENLLHYPRDVWLHEDASRVRTGQAPVVMASIRNSLLNLLRGFGYRSIKQARELFAVHPHRALGLLELPLDFRLE